MTKYSLSGPMDEIRQDEIDLLVEGELSPLERDQLVLRLDRQANGWRRCALAFMERDALRGSLVAIRQSSESGSALCLNAQHSLANELDVLKSPNTVRSSSSRFATVALCATAATLLIAIGIGLGNWLRPEPAHSTGFSNRGPEGQQGVDSLEAEQSPDVWLQVSNAVNRLDVADSEVIAVVGVPREHAQIEFLPIIQSETLRQQVLELPKPDLPRGYQEQAERAGWKFDVSRQLLSLKLPDGGNQLLPLDTVRYRYVGFESF